MMNVASVAIYNFQSAICIGYWQHFLIGNIKQPSTKGARRNRRAPPRLSGFGALAFVIAFVRRGGRVGRFIFAVYRHCALVVGRYRLILRDDAA